MRGPPLFKFATSILFPALLGALAAGCGGSSRHGGFTTTSAGATSGTSAVSTAGSGGVSATSSSTLPSGTLDALTYNVAGLPQGISSSSPVTNIPQISPLLNRYELVVVQEDFWYHPELMKDAQHPYQSLPLTQYSTLVNDGLNRFADLPFYDHVRQRWNSSYGFLDHGSDSFSSKGFSAARHELGPGVVVDVYDLHADAGGSAGDEWARADEFAQLSAFIATYSQGHAVIVAGDTNMKRRRSADLQTLQDFASAANLQDVSQVLPNVPDTIDRFFYRSNADVELRPLSWRYADEFIDAAGQPLSDHEAVNVTFAWRRLR